MRRFPVTILITVLVLSGCLLWRREPGINVTRYGVRANATECQANAINAAINDLIERDGAGRFTSQKGNITSAPASTSAFSQESILWGLE